MDDILKIADITVSGAALILVLLMVRKTLAALVEWLPKFHVAVAQQSKAVVDLAEASKASQGTQEATLATVRSLAAETDRQSDELSLLHEQHGEMLGLLRGLAGKQEAGTV